MCTHAPILKSKICNSDVCRVVEVFLEFQGGEDTVLLPVLKNKVWTPLFTLSNKKNDAKWCTALDCEIAGRDCWNVSERGSGRERPINEEQEITFSWSLCCVWLYFTRGTCVLDSGSMELCTQTWTEAPTSTCISGKTRVKHTLYKISRLYYFGMWSFSAFFLLKKKNVHFGSNSVFPL